MLFKAHIIEKIQGLIRVHYQLHKPGNEKNYLNFFWSD